MVRHLEPVHQSRLTAGLYESVWTHDNVLMISSNAVLLLSPQCPQSPAHHGRWKPWYFEMRVPAKVGPVNCGGDEEQTAAG